MEGITHMGKTKDIREAVEAELAFDPLVDATAITVMNMNGEVALNGTVPIAVATTAAKYRFWDVGGRFPALEPVADGGYAIRGEVYYAEKNRPAYAPTPGGHT